MNAISNRYTKAFLLVVLVILCQAPNASAACSEWSWRDPLNWCGLQPQPSSQPKENYDPVQVRQQRIEGVREVEKIAGRVADAFEGTPLEPLSRPLRVVEQVSGGMADSGQSFDEASQAVKTEQQSRHDQCQGDGVCEAKNVTGKNGHYATNVNATLSLENENSYASRMWQRVKDRTHDFIKNELQDKLDELVGSTISKFDQEYSNSSTGLTAGAAQRSSEQLQLTSRQIEQQSEQRMQQNMQNSLGNLQNSVNARQQQMQQARPPRTYTPPAQNSRPTSSGSYRPVPSQQPAPYYPPSSDRGCNLPAGSACAIYER